MKPDSPAITASTRLFAVFGHPVAHSLSPAMHNPALRAMGLDAVYLAFDVPPEELRSTLERFAVLGAGGVNLTIPHKEEAFRFISDLTDEAHRAGSVNTVEFLPDGTLRGHSTDGYGLSQAVKEAFGAGFAGRDVLILGCGGAGRAAALQAAVDGAASLTLANRSTQKVGALADELSKLFPDLTINRQPVWPPAPEAVAAADLIIQSTSLGMKPGETALLPPEQFRSGQDVLDMTYVVQETPLMASARQGGARAVNGLGMLLHQGVRSLEIWTGKDVPVERMRDALFQTAYGGASSC